VNRYSEYLRTLFFFFFPPLALPCIVLHCLEEEKQEEEEEEEGEMNTAFSRIQKDIREVNSITAPDNPPIFAEPVGDKLDHVEALVIGPPDTPYSFGFFKFDLRFSPTYPNVPPKVLITTTDQSRTRFNPNLYAEGKVCLSILGTWSGESEDEWRSSYSIAYILQAIQSLIMNSKPYHNEPGYEETGSRSTSGDVEKYSEKIKHETLRVAVCGVVEDAINKPNFRFAEIIKAQFLLWYNTYIRLASEGVGNDGNQFASMPFEHPGNAAIGKFNYTAIISKLNTLKATLDQETEDWKAKGVERTKDESGSKYFRLIEEYDKLKKGDVNIEGVSAGPVNENNVFYWNVSIFGPDGSPWEGGIFNVELVFYSGETGDAPPRVRFTTSMFHPHISPDGVPFLLIPQGLREPVVPILKGLKKLFTDEIKSSPATWANYEAAKMNFSKDPNTVKEYKKQVARCVRRSTEDA